MQKGDEYRRPQSSSICCKAANKIPICLQIVSTWQNFTQKFEPMARPQATAALGGVGRVLNAGVPGTGVQI